MAELHSGTGPAIVRPARGLAWSGGAFILLFFLFFSYHALFSYFTFDDGTTIYAALRLFDHSFWDDLVHVLTVLTPAFRPLTTLFWRPLYAIFGFNPLPYRIVVHVLLTANIGLAYWLARRLNASREAAALTALIFCYNASTLDLYYNTCLVGDITCFSAYGLALGVYARGRDRGNPIDWGSIAAVGALYMLALDSKELGVALPGIFLIYEAMYRRADLRDRRRVLRISCLLGAMFVIGAIYLKVKVMNMAPNPAYTPKVTVPFVVANIGHYLEQLLYQPEKSVSPLMGCLIVLGFLAAAALVRSREAIFGTLYFVVGLIPVAVIAGRGGYAAYLAYFGLSLAGGAILAAARSRLVTRKSLETVTAVALFLCAAVLLGWGHMVHRMPGTGYYEWSNPPIISFMKNFQRDIPDFPPSARVLVDKDPWAPDWGPMFLLRLMYGDHTLWVDRTRNMDNKPDLSSYDMVVSYYPADVDLSPARAFRKPMKWEIRGKSLGVGSFVISSPNANGAASRIAFTPQGAKSGQNVTLTVSGLSSVAISAVYRIESGTTSTVRVAPDWCILDDKGSCTVPAPAAAAHSVVRIDWIQPRDKRWIFTSGVMRITE